MKKIKIILFTILFSNFLFADGPPMDTTGKIRSKYVAIKLEANQINHLQVCRWLQLTTEQRKKVHFLKLPKYIDITAPFYNDCICGMIYAMWFRLDSIAFAVKDTTTTVEFDLHEGGECINHYGKSFDRTFKKYEIYIGTTGQLFYMGKLIDIKDVDQIVNDFKYEGTGDKFFLFIQPPITNNPNALFVLRAKNKLKKMKFEKCNVYWG